MSKIKRRIAAVLTAAALGLGGSVAAASSSSAASCLATNGCIVWQFYYDGVAIRSAPYTTGTTIYGRGYYPQRAQHISYAYGSSYKPQYGSTSTLWTKSKNLTTGVTGYSGVGFMERWN
ncbi:MAG: hypothetical protein FWD11_07840 [Micrococcales bacterium]|nr:hypothetical protein [Micrococcales bacterium]